MAKTCFVYIMASPSRTTYVGVTSNLERRVWEHKQKHSLTAHTRKYNEVLLVHAEEYPDPLSAIAREKELKNWNRARKLVVIDSSNPRWLDLSAEW